MNTTDIQGLGSLPVVRLLKEPVKKLADLYKRYPTGGEYGWFVYVDEAKNLAFWDTDTKKWEYFFAGTWHVVNSFANWLDGGGGEIWGAGTFAFEPFIYDFRSGVFYYLGDDRVADFGRGIYAKNWSGNYAELNHSTQRLSWSNFANTKHVTYDQIYDAVHREPTNNRPTQLFNNSGVFTADGQSRRLLTDSIWKWFDWGNMQLQTNSFEYDFNQGRFYSDGLVAGIDLHQGTWQAWTNLLNLYSGIIRFLDYDTYELKYLTFDQIYDAVHREPTNNRPTQLFNNAGAVTVNGNERRLTGKTFNEHFDWENWILQTDSGAYYNFRRGFLQGNDAVSCLDIPDGYWVKAANNHATEIKLNTNEWIVHYYDARGTRSVNFNQLYDVVQKNEDNNFFGFPSKQTVGLFEYNFLDGEISYRGDGTVANFEKGIYAKNFTNGRAELNLDKRCLMWYDVNNMNQKAINFDHLFEAVDGRNTPKKVLVNNSGHITVDGHSKRLLSANRGHFDWEAMQIETHNGAFYDFKTGDFVSSDLINEFNPFRGNWFVQSKGGAGNVSLDLASESIRVTNWSSYSEYTLHFDQIHNAVVNSNKTPTNLIDNQNKVAVNGNTRRLITSEGIDIFNWEHGFLREPYDGKLKIDLWESWLMSTKGICTIDWENCVLINPTHMETIFGWDRGIRFFNGAGVATCPNPIPNATNATDVITRLNELLTVMRQYGLIRQ